LAIIHKVIWTCLGGRFFRTLYKLNKGKVRITSPLLMTNLTCRQTRQLLETRQTYSVMVRFRILLQNSNYKFNLMKLKFVH